MLGLKLIHVSKRGHREQKVDELSKFVDEILPNHGMCYKYDNRHFHSLWDNKIINDGW